MIRAARTPGSGPFSGQGKVACQPVMCVRASACEAPQEAMALAVGPLSHMQRREHVRDASEA